MSNMKMSEMMDRMMAQSIEEAVRALAKDKSDAATDTFVNALLERLGLRANIDEVLYAPRMPLVAAAAHAAAKSSSDDNASVSSSVGDAKSAVSADRKRTVSKKMKDTFLAMEGGTEDALKAAMKVYKNADQAQIDAWGGKWDSFARAFLAGECTPVKKSKTAPAAPGAPKKEKAPKEARNFTWTPTAKKLFTETVEGGGGKVTDALKDEFAAHVNAKTVDDFKVLAPVGHMRSFVASKSPSAAVVAPEDNDDEDLEEIEVEGETLTIGVKSGKIFRATEDSGDVQIGVAGQGKFKDVKIPSA
jgi:hypothetical protein